MRHENGSGYALCPKVATEDMIFAPDIDIGPKTATKTWSIMIEASPSYEPSDEDIEKSAGSIFEAWAAFEESDMTWNEVLRAKA